jgi:regulator of protease activity HflC (stomatin/prohibitin superfamily)
MDILDRYSKVTSHGERAFNVPRIIRDIALLVGAWILLALLWPFYSVPTGSRGVVTQFGKIVGIENEGLAVLPPWQRLTLFSIRSEAADIENASGATSDTQPVSVSLTVRYSILPNKVAEVYEKYSHNGDLSSYVQTATHEIFKAVTARYTAPDLIAQRAKVSADIYEALGQKLAIYGAQVINIDMRNFAFQESYMRAINSKVEQEQLRQAADNKLKTVESEQKQKVAIAEAEAAAVKATADGNAYATLKLAEAQAEALKIQNVALASGPNVLELRRIQVEQTKAERWNGALPGNVYAGAPIPFFSPQRER